MGLGKLTVDLCMEGLMNVLMELNVLEQHKLRSYSTTELCTSPNF